MSPLWIVGLSLSNSQGRSWSVNWWLRIVWIVKTLRQSSLPPPPLAPANLYSGDLGEVKVFYNNPVREAMERLPSCRREAEMQVAGFGLFPPFMAEAKLELSSGLLAASSNTNPVSLTSPAWICQAFSAVTRWVSEPRRHLLFFFILAGKDLEGHPKTHPLHKEHTTTHFLDLNQPSQCAEALSVKLLGPVRKTAKK